MSTTPEETRARGELNSSQAAIVILGALVLVAIGLWFFVLRGGDEPLETTAPAPAPIVSPVPEETQAAKPDRNGPDETFEVFAPKDPFRPLISQVGTGGDASLSGTFIDPGTTGSGSTGTGTGQPSGGSDISGGGSGGDSVGGHRVRLVDTFRAGGEDRARVQVDGTVYTVSEGDRFADNFQLVSISGSCASMLFGDDQFSLCEGEEILK